MDLLRRWTQVNHYAYGLLGFGGLIATIALSAPGLHAIVLGSFRVDAFWFSIVTFGVLLVIAAFDAYDPEEYGFSTSDAEE